ncbi:LysR substrate-binding domain-containing protein [Arthrobacter sp. NPDC090010]|uniref:LysR substrate-binding domain-containing protein n=1 Tax=Arthrobacter sp. NPDC090010 TaxID=3363942 RepID=UPI003814F5AB
MKITLRQVEIFLAVAEELHFARAAERLLLSQPTVSQEIRRLERGLGIELFDRSRRAAALSAAGAALMKESAELLAAAQRLVRAAERLAEPRAKAVTVVASPSVINKLLPDAIRVAEDQLPELRIHDVGVNTGGILEGIQTHSGDIGLGRFLPSIPGHEKEVLVEEPVMAVLSVKHPAAREETLELDTLGDLPLLLWPREQNPGYYDALLGICTDRNLTPLILVSSPLIVGARSYLIAENRAFALVPRSAVGHLAPGTTAVHLKAPARLPLEMLVPAHDPRPDVVSFLDIIRAQARHLGD